MSNRRTRTGVNRKRHLKHHKVNIDKKNIKVGNKLSTSTGDSSPQVLAATVGGAVVGNLILPGIGGAIFGGIIGAFIGNGSRNKGDK